MTIDDQVKLHMRARWAGFLFLAVNALYIASLMTGTLGPEALHRPAVALQVTASVATILLAWTFYELLKPVSESLALIALLFRTAEAALFGVFAVFSIVLLSGADDGAFPAVNIIARGAQYASGHVAQLFFCAGSIIFFYLLLRGGVLPRAIAILGLIATIISLVATLITIGAPRFAAYLAFHGPLLLLAEAIAGVWLVVGGAGRLNSSAR